MKNVWINTDTEAPVNADPLIWEIMDGVVFTCTSLQVPGPYLKVYGGVVSLRTSALWTWGRGTNDIGISRNVAANYVELTGELNLQRKAP